MCLHRHKLKIKYRLYLLMSKSIIKWGKIKTAAVLLWNMIPVTRKVAVRYEVGILGVLSKDSARNTECALSKGRKPTV